MLTVVKCLPPARSRRDLLGQIGCTGLHRPDAETEDRLPLRLGHTLPSSHRAFSYLLLALYLEYVCMSFFLLYRWI